MCEQNERLTVTELIPVRERLRGLPPPSSPYEIKKDLKDREAICITVKGLTFDKSATFEVRRSLFHLALVALFYYFSPLHLQLHKSSTVDHLRLAISQYPELGTEEDRAAGRGVPVQYQVLDRGYRQFWREVG